MTPPYRSTMGGMDMSWKKKLLAILAVLLLLGCDYLYWTLELPLADKLPEAVQNTMGVQLFYYDDFFTSREITVEQEAVADILNALEGTAVTRCPKFGTMSQPFFYLYLHYPNGYTRLLVVENGDISADPDMDSDRRIYFDGGEELFQALLPLTEQDMP